MSPASSRSGSSDRSSGAGRSSRSRSGGSTRGAGSAVGAGSARGGERPAEGALVAAADGSALGNPGPAGWAWYIDEDCWQAGGWKHGTNNMGELKAVLDLLESTAHLPERPLHILCDSQYVINCITKWMPGWKRNGWVKKDRKPVLNRDLLEALDAALQGREYHFEWVKGHSGHPLNEAADERARAAATAYQRGGSPETGPGFADTDDAPSAEPECPAGEAEEDPRDLEIRLSEPETHDDPEALAALLDEDLCWVTPLGRVTDRATALRYPNKAFPLEAVEAWVHHREGEDEQLIVSRVRAGRGSVLRSSLWTRGPRGWRLRFRQDTPAPSVSP